MKDEDNGVKRPTGSCFGNVWDDKFEAGGFTFFRRAFSRPETVRVTLDLLQDNTLSIPENQRGLPISN